MNGKKSPPSTSPATGKEPEASASQSTSLPLRLGDDYYYNEAGLLVFTEAYHRRRGYCCESGCRHCPYGFKPK